MLISRIARRCGAARARQVLLGLGVFAGGCSDPVVREVFVDADPYVPSGDRPSEPGALGEACIPQDEDFPSFSGFVSEELNLSSRDAQCRSGSCLVDHFQGRVSCPQGNQDGNVCRTPLGERVSVSVAPQLPGRPAEAAVYCTCRCDGPPGTGPLCACPTDMSCEPRIDGSGYLDDPQVEYVGSYCVKP
jgi:hypothetical protein